MGLHHLHLTRYVIDLVDEEYQPHRLACQQPSSLAAPDAFLSPDGASDSIFLVTGELSSKAFLKTPDPFLRSSEVPFASHFDDFASPFADCCEECGR